MKPFHIAVCFILLALISCSGKGGGSSPITPSFSPEPDQLTDRRLTSDSNRIALSAWVMNISSDHTSYELLPLRTGSGHFNIRTFLENQPCDNCFQIVDFVWQSGDVLDVDIRITHPFPGIDEFTIFDLRTVLIFPATSSWPENNLTYSRADAGGGDLLNPDGWTNLFNPVDFEQEPGDLNVLTYQQGKFATDLTDPSTLNPYRAFYHEPDRRPFFTTQSLTRTLSISIPQGEFQIGYVVDASWGLPDPNPPQNIPEDFPIEANCIEAFRISAHVDEGLTETYGTAECEIEIYDWQGTSTISGVVIECPALFQGTMAAQLDMDFGYISRWSAEMENQIGTLAGDYPLLIRIDDSNDDPLLGPIRAYFMINAHIDPADPYEDDVFVDRDYPGIPGGLPENGTPEAPFRSINTAVLVAHGVKIHIDPSPDPYDEQVYLKSNRWLMGDNWRPDGDSGLPVLEASEHESTIYAVAASDIVIENLEIRPGGDLWEEFLYGILLDYYDPYMHVQNATVRNCVFTGDRVHTGNDYGDEVICCEAILTDNFIFEDNLITECYVGSDQGGYFGGLHVDVCDGVIVRRNTITNCVTRNSFLGMHIWYSDLPVLVEDNELSYIHNSDEPTGFTIGWGINVIGYSDVTVRHNTIHDIGLPGHRLETIPFFFRATGNGQYYNWVIENNLIYNIHAQDADNTYNSADCRGIMFRSNSYNDLDGLVIANNTLHDLTSGEYVTGMEFDIGPNNHIENYRIDNNIIQGLHGPPVPDPYATSAAIYCYWPMDDLLIEYSLFDEIDIPDSMFYGIDLGEGVLVGEDPNFLINYHLPYDSPGQKGNPNFIDYDDSGSPSGNPGDPDPETRSRMGAFGGPEGDW